MTSTRRLTTMSHDGLTLFAREWGPRDSDKRPIVCLPGLSRNSRDFNTLGQYFGDPQGAGRRVIAVDYRGRGLSDWDPDWENYSLPNEQRDILAMLEHAGIRHADFIGTSRGGLHVMLLSASKPDMIGKAVLNDIGPVIEVDGLRRLATTIGCKPAHVNWASAAAVVRREQQALFPELDSNGWQTFARQLYRERDGEIVADYDPALGNALKNMDFTEQPAPMWELFAGLEVVPTLTLRGALSDLLSEASLAEMHARQPNMESLTIENQGHAPLLWDTPTLRAIDTFLD